MKPHIGRSEETEEVVYVPATEDDIAFARREFPNAEIIPVPGLQISFVGNSLSVQIYLRERGLEHLLRPLPGDPASLYDSMQRGWQPTSHTDVKDDQ